MLTLLEEILASAIAGCIVAMFTYWLEHRNNKDSTNQ
ncbi:type I toxin-antitoxin system Fst family toxin [Macrococcus equipercicus]|uniref:Type I toxin-antitoxin system Fst family toxin n=1 Tax=Macrococcus equipercicus TaxID=69967 RepID=A0ABQ6R9F4_9STAP|nr:type I toxin-antitoxin system Fst family toxin [Macrococcus equipercicus]KAA1039957.1 type I toxin-antitoxin system Fst family toxin [Macrococcus equipercicus]